jgi:hypothetical protein
LPNNYKLDPYLASLNRDKAKIEYEFKLLLKILIISENLSKLLKSMSQFISKTGVQSTKNSNSKLPKIYSRLDENNGALSERLKSTQSHRSNFNKSMTSRLSIANKSTSRLLAAHPEARSRILNSSTENLSPDKMQSKPNSKFVVVP